MEQGKNGTIKPKRPVIITAVCIFGFIGILFVSGALLFNRELLLQKYGPSFIPITVLTTLALLVGFIGYWKMRKWGVYVYTIVAILSILYGLILNITGAAGYLGPIIVILVGMMHLRKMT